ELARRELLKELLIGQKDLVDEVDVLDSLGQQPVELVEYHFEWTLPIVIAEIVLRAKCAVVRAAARRFHFRAGSQRTGVEAMMVMAVPANRIHRPAQRRQ